MQLGLIQSSFPSPLPLGPADDEVCGNRTLLDAHLCSPLEVQLYYEVRKPKHGRLPGFVTYTLRAGDTS